MRSLLGFFNVVQDFEKVLRLSKSSPEINEIVNSSLGEQLVAFIENNASERKDP